MSFSFFVTRKQREKNLVYCATCDYYFRMAEKLIAIYYDFYNDMKKEDKERFLKEKKALLNMYERHKRWCFVEFFYKEREKQRRNRNTTET